MKDRQREAIVNRILVGNQFYKHNDEVYIITNPTVEDKYWADELYEKTLFENLYEGMYKLEDVHLLLAMMGIWNNKDDDKLDKLEKDLESMKVEIYNSRAESKRVKAIGDKIAQTLTRISSMYETKHSLDHVTAEGHATLVRRQYILLKTVKNKDGQPIDTNSQKIQNIFYFLSRNQMTIEQIREIARNEPWRSYWDISKPKPFSVPFEVWSDEQRILVKYSKMYDGIFSHPDCPSDQVIDNDYMLDGWIIVQNKKQAGEKTASNNSMVSPNVARHTEQFIAQNEPLRDEYGYVLTNKAGRTLFTKTEEFTPEQVEKLNSPQSKLIKKERANLIAEKGQVKEAQLPDVKADLINQIYERNKNG